MPQLCTLAWPPGTRRCMIAPQTAACRAMTVCDHPAPPAESFPGVGTCQRIQLEECCLPSGQEFPEATLLWVVVHSDAQSDRREGSRHCPLLGSDPMCIAPPGSQLPRDRTPEYLGGWCTRWVRWSRGTRTAHFIGFISKLRVKLQGAGVDLGTRRIHSSRAATWAQTMGHRYCREHRTLRLEFSNRTRGTEVSLCY